MCRILAYVGDPIDLHTVLYGAPHSLEHQCRHARLQDPSLGGRNDDGWGVGWYPVPGAPPERYRTSTAMDADAAFRAGAAATTATLAVAAVRRASPGATITASGSSPFVAPPWLFTHNGFVAGFREGLGEELRAEVSADRQAGIEGDADSEVVFALVLDRLDAGEPPADALRAVVEELGARAPDSKLNLLLSDGATVWATRAGNSLFAHDAWTGGRVVASEPLDDDAGWWEVPTGALVTLTAVGTTIDQPERGRTDA